MSERIAGGLSCEVGGLGGISIMLKALLNRRFAFVRPLGLAVLEKLLQDRKTDFAVVHCVTEIAGFINPRRRNPRQRQTGKFFDVILSARSGIGQNSDIRLTA